MSQKQWLQTEWLDPSYFNDQSSESEDGAYELPPTTIVRDYKHWRYHYEAVLAELFDSFKRTGRLVFGNGFASRSNSFELFASMIYKSM